MPKRTVPSEIAKLSDDELIARFLDATTHPLQPDELKTLRDALGVDPGHQGDIVLKEGNLVFLSATMNTIQNLMVDAVDTTPLLRSPPRLVEGVFWLVLPRKVREAILGDAAEAYAQTMQKYGGRRWIAILDYCKEALFASFAALRMSASEWIQMLFRRSS